MACSKTRSIDDDIHRVFLSICGHNSSGGDCLNFFV
jgi:hypothetical protein